MKVDDESRHANTYKVYKRRWLVLVSWCVLSFSSAPISTSFTAISNILQYFYDVQPIAIHILMALFGVTIIIFSLPASYILHKFELAFVLKMAAVLNLSGSVIRYFAYDETYGYYLLLTANTLSAISLTSYVFLPAKVATNWFAEGERGTVIGICLGFDLMSTGVGFLHTTRMVPNGQDRSEIKHGLKAVFLHELVAAVLSCIVIFFVKSRPPTPPSQIAEDKQNSYNVSSVIYEKTEHLEGQIKIQHDPNIQHKNLNQFSSDNLKHSSCTTQQVDFEIPPTFWKCVRVLLKHRCFLTIIHISAITTSLEITFEMILNDVLIKIFPGKEKEIGIIGFIAIILGLVSNIAAGVILDKTKAYKAMTWIIFSLSGLCLITWTLLLELYHSFTLISISFCSLVMISTSYYAVGNTHIVVVTQPIDPGTSIVIEKIVAAFYAIIFSLSSSFVLTHIRVLYVNITAVILVLIAMLLTFVINSKETNSERDLRNVFENKDVEKDE